MEPLRNAERQKQGTEKLKNEGKYKNFRKKKTKAYPRDIQILGCCLARSF